MSTEPLKVRLGEFVEHQKGFAFKSSEYSQSGLPIVRVSNFTDRSINMEGCFFISAANAGQYERFKLKYLDVVIATVGSWPTNPASVVGKTICVPKEAEGSFLNQNAVILRAKGGLVQRYLFYLLKTPEFQSHIVSKAQGSANQASITLEDIFSFEFNKPSLERQNAIAQTLGTLDDKIELNRKMNETLEAMARATFKSWFIDFDPVRAKMDGRWRKGQSLPGLPAELFDLFPEKIEMGDLGTHPVGWQHSPFIDLVEILGGGTPKTTVTDYWNGEIPWFSVVDAPAQSDVFVIQTEKTITQKGVENSSAKILPVGTTIITARGTVGKIAIVGREMAMNQSCYGLVGKNANPYFTYFATNSVVETLKSKSHGSVFDTITRSTFESVYVPMPHPGLYPVFEKFVEPLLLKIKVNLEESMSLAKIRDSLLSPLIAGQLPIENSAILITEAGL